MKRYYLFTLSLMLFFSCSAAAQQSFLAVQDDKNDPCRRFKMRVLAPVGLDSFKPRAVKPEGADYKIRVWNPCQQKEPQFALLEPPFPLPYMRAGIAPNASRVRFPFPGDEQKKSIEPFSATPFPATPSWFWEQRRLRK